MISDFNSPKIELCDVITETESSLPLEMDELITPRPSDIDDLPSPCKPTRPLPPDSRDLSPESEKPLFLWNPQPMGIRKLNNGRFSSNMCTWYFNEGFEPITLNEESFDWNMQVLTPVMLILTY